MRIGFGYDVHPFVEGRDLILGGVKIPFEKGLQGHSDADALCHAITDAILGSIAAGDIGTHFPDSDDRYRDISSLMLLEKTREMVKKRSCQIINIDSTVVLQKPKINKFTLSMRQNIANSLSIDIDQVSVKATTDRKSVV